MMNKKCVQGNTEFRPAERGPWYRLDKIRDTDVREAVYTAAKVLPRRLRGLRESQDLSLSDVAAELGVTKQTLGQYEMGVNLPTVCRLVALAAFYGVTLDWLIWDEEQRGVNL